MAIQSSVYWEKGVFLDERGKEVGKGDKEAVRDIVCAAFGKRSFVGAQRISKGTFSWKVATLPFAAFPTPDVEKVLSDTTFQRIKKRELLSICAQLCTVHSNTEGSFLIECIKRGEIPLSVDPALLAIHTIRGYCQGLLSKDEMTFTMLISYVLSAYEKDEFCIVPFSGRHITKAKSLLTQALLPYFTGEEIESVLDEIEVISQIERHFVLCVENVRDLETILREGGLSDLEFRRHILHFPLMMVQENGIDMLLLLPPSIIRMLHAKHFSHPVEHEYTLGFSERWIDCQSSQRIVAVPSPVVPFSGLVHGRKGGYTALFVHDLCHGYVDSGNSWRDTHFALSLHFAKRGEYLARCVFYDRDFPYFSRKEVRETLFNRELTSVELFWVSIAHAFVQMKTKDTCADASHFFKVVLEAPEVSLIEKDCLPSLASCVVPHLGESRALIEALRSLEEVHERTGIVNTLLELKETIESLKEEEGLSKKTWDLFVTLPLVVQTAIYKTVYNSLEYHRGHPKAGELAFWGREMHRCSYGQRVKAIETVLNDWV